MSDVSREYTEDAEYRFRVDGQGASIMRCIAHDAQVRVPALLGGCPVVALDPECFASVEGGGLSLHVFNGDLQSVRLPEGLVRIGRAAFRGCSRLSSVELPDSLARIDALAFSCTSLDRVRIPRACVHLDPLALRTGPQSLAGPAAPYFSRLDAISADPGNVRYCERCGALCRRMDAGGLEVVLCPGKAGELRLGADIFSLAETAFAGTYEIGALAFCESLRFENGCGIALQAACETVEIALTHPAGGFDRITLPMPSRSLQRGIFESTAHREAFDLGAFTAAYDAAVLKEDDRLLQAKLMLARLARPVCLEGAYEAPFRRALEQHFETLCIQFGMRKYYQGFDDMADAGLFDASSIACAVEVLAARADAAASAYVLELKRARFGGGGWDYAL